MAECGWGALPGRKIPSISRLPILQVISDDNGDDGEEKDGSEGSEEVKVDGSSASSSSESGASGDDDDEDDKGTMNRVTLHLWVLRSSGFRVAELKRRGKLILARLDLVRCLAVVTCISSMRDARLLLTKMSLELVWASMLLARPAIVV